MNSYKVRFAAATSTAVLALTAAMPAVSGATSLTNPELSFPGAQQPTFAKCVEVLRKKKPEVGDIKIAGNKYIDNRLKWLDSKNPEAVKKQLDGINQQIDKIKTQDEKYLAKLQKATKTGGVAAAAPIKLNGEYTSYAPAINLAVSQAKSDIQAAKITINNATSPTVAAQALCSAHWQIRVYPYVQLLTNWYPRFQKVTNLNSLNKALYTQIAKLPPNKVDKLPNPSANDAQIKALGVAIQLVSVTQINQMVNQNANYNSRKEFNDKYDATYKQLVKKLVADNNQLRGPKLKH